MVGSWARISQAEETEGSNLPHPQNVDYETLTKLNRKGAYIKDFDKLAESLKAELIKAIGMKKRLIRTVLSAGFL